MNSINRNGKIMVAGFCEADEEISISPCNIKLLWPKMPQKEITDSVVRFYRTTAKFGRRRQSNREHGKPCRPKGNQRMGASEPFSAKCRFGEAECQSSRKDKPAENQRFEQTLRSGLYVQ